MVHKVSLQASIVPALLLGKACVSGYKAWQRRVMMLLVRLVLDGICRIWNRTSPTNIFKLRPTRKKSYVIRFKHIFGTLHQVFLRISKKYGSGTIPDQGYSESGLSSDQGCSGIGAAPNWGSVERRGISPPFLYVTTMQLCSDKRKQWKL